MNGAFAKALFPNANLERALSKVSSKTKKIKIETKNALFGYFMLKFEKKLLLY